MLDPEVAMQPGAPQLHPHSKDNVCYNYRIRKGDVGAGFAECSPRRRVIVEGVYQTPVQEHAYLQPEAGVAYLDEKGASRSRSRASGRTWTRSRSRTRWRCPTTRCA